MENNNINFKEIYKLSAILTMLEIEHTFEPFTSGGKFIGYQIRPTEGEWDVVCHKYSYGGEYGLLEGYMGNFVSEHDDVMGGLTAVDAIKIILK